MGVKLMWMVSLVPALLLSLASGSTAFEFNLRDDTDDDTTDSDVTALDSEGATASAMSASSVSSSSKTTCKCYPGDSCYPAAKAFTALSTSVSGNLQIALPPGAPCYKSMEGIPTYNAAKCADAEANYGGEQWTTDQPIANMWPYWTNDTCLPPNIANAGSTCTRGFYGDWVLMAKTKAHIKAGIDFVRTYNLRLVIRNTGHDFLGRSTGWGSFIINTHALKDVNFTTAYTGPGSYKGSAVTVGAGIQTRDLYRLANAQNPPVVIVGGECPTVGFAGGYIQGGGHGPLATLHGLAADQALSFDVITAAGNYVTANEVSNSDLFWALRGGGPSTFAAVVSVTVKTFPEIPSAGIILNINSTHTNDTNLFWKGVAAFHNQANHFVDNGIFAYYELGPPVLGNRLHVQPIVGPNMTAAQLMAVAKPMFDSLNSQGIPYSTVTKEFPTFFSLYIDMFEDEIPGDALVGGRMFNRNDIAANPAAIVSAFKTARDGGAFLIGHIVGPGHGAPSVNDAANPAWRNASSFTIISLGVNGNAPLSEKAAAQNTVTNVMGAAFRKASPNGGGYINEGDLEEPNWQTAYWGSNYAKLAKLKTTWDPNGLFYARTTPGTEAWSTGTDGTRLCKTS